MILMQYETKDALVKAYASTRPELHSQFHRDAAKYVPHLYRGGYVIRGFGYSVERIGKFISKEEAGNPVHV